MTKYETIKTIHLDKNNTFLPTSQLPELVHLDDPAFAVMTDFYHMPPHITYSSEPIDDALNEMKTHGVHLLLVLNKSSGIEGVIASEDILGEKPITIIQEKRIDRSHVLTTMVMTPIDTIPAFDIHAIRHARVGNIVDTLKSLRTHYALVVENAIENKAVLRGIFTTSQISRQLHRRIADSIAKAQSLSELQRRHD